MFNDCALPYRGCSLARFCVFIAQPANVCYRTEGLAASAQLAMQITKGGPVFDDDRAPFRVLEDERVAATLFVGSTTEPSPGAALLASELGILIVDAETGAVLETLPLSERKSGQRINGNVVHNTYPPRRARIPDGVVCDISPHTRPLRQARLRVEELTTANRRKDEFLAMLSHELRSPLAAIQNAVRLLSSQTGETPLRQRTQALIERQVRRMTQLVDDLLDVSRVSHGRLHRQRERIDLRVVVSNAIETLELDINERHQQLTSALPDAPVWLRADPWRLEQVFVNLLANASRYTDAGGEVAVWVDTRDGQAVVGIRDSGIGIAPDALPHIFDLFKQADEAAPAASAGIGQGSEFTVRLPRQALKTTSRSAGT